MASNECLWAVYEHISPSGKVYVGITHYDNPNLRWQNGLGYQKCPFFWPAIVKYGWDNFQHKIVANGLSRTAACNMEKELIAQYKELQLSYNSADGGIGHTGKFTDEHRKHISESSRSGEPEIRLKISQSLKAKHLTPWNKGKTGVYTNETRQRISQSQMGKVSPMKGKKVGPMPDEIKAKISKANKGKNTWSKGSKQGPRSEETRRLISKALTGKRKGISTGPRSEETKAKISNIRKGYKWISKPWDPPKQVPNSEFDKYIGDGWSPGKLIRIDDKTYKWDKSLSTWQIYEQT